MNSGTIQASESFTVTNTDMKTDNELIAEFMGDEAMWFKHGKTKIRLYDTSWDWLMPVVEKIESITSTEVDIYLKACEIDVFGQYELIMYDRQESKIIATYKAVVDFIKWYNEQNK